MAFLGHFLRHQAGHIDLGCLLDMEGADLAISFDQAEDRPLVASARLLLQKGLALAL